MKIVFHASDKPRETALAYRFLKGARLHGHHGATMPLSPTPKAVPCDLACMVGVKSNELFHACKAAGQRVLYFDKGYIRSRSAGVSSWDYWRLSLDAHQPTSTTLMMFKEPWDRFEALEVQVEKWRRGGLQIVIAGSSEKYHRFHGLPDPTTYAYQIVETIRQSSDRPIMYRPKPSWRDAVPVEGTWFSGPKDRITGALANAHCLVTHGSNACFEAMVLGIPTIVLGDAVAKPISSTSLDEIEQPMLGKRGQLLANLAHHQWNEDEMRSGQTWEMVAKWLT